MKHDFFLENVVAVIHATKFERLREVFLIQLLLILVDTGLAADGLLSRTEDLSIVTDVGATIDFDTGNINLQVHKILMT